MNPTLALHDLITLDLIRHPEQFRVSRPGMTIAIKGKLSVQLAAESQVLIYLNCRLVLRLRLSEFLPSRLVFEQQIGWSYAGRLIGKDPNRG
jgi:hypothetical protein